MRWRTAVVFTGVAYFRGEEKTPSKNSRALVISRITNAGSTRPFDASHVGTGVNVQIERTL